jgi:hypothetical protein
MRDEPKFGSAIFRTGREQVFTESGECRIVLKSDFAGDLYVGAMLSMGRSDGA